MEVSLEMPHNWLLLSLELDLDSSFKYKPSFVIPLRLTNGPK